MPRIRVWSRGASRRRRWFLLRSAPLVLVALGVYALATRPDFAGLAKQEPRTTAFIERYRKRFGDADLHWTWVPYARISPHLKRAVLVGEDVDFFSHHGFERSEIRRALAEAWEERELPRGASTISQQLAKNLWLSPSWNPIRKLREAVLTWQMERHLTKRRILEIYLNVVEFGPGIYGAEAAARCYFGKSAAELTPGEAAQLAAGLPKPRLWHPGGRSRAYQRRIARLLRRMERADFLWRQI